MIDMKHPHGKRLPSIGDEENNLQVQYSTERKENTMENTNTLVTITAEEYKTLIQSSVQIAQISFAIDNTKYSTDCIKIIRSILCQEEDGTDE